MSDDKDDPFGSAPSDNPFGSAPSDNPFGAPPPNGPFAGSKSPDAAPPSGSGEPPAPDPWRAPPATSDAGYGPPPVASAPRAEGAIPALVLGILGIVICPLCAPFAWVFGRQAEQKVDASGGTLSGRGEATAGKILGIISCCLTVLAILLFIVLVVVGRGMSTAS